MLSYILEFEESVGKAWDRYLRQKVNRFYPQERVYFGNMSKKLPLFYLLLGGEKGKSLRITDKRYIDTKRTLLERISFLGKAFLLTWQDDKALYLPHSLAYFPDKKYNEMHYYWLVAMTTQVNVSVENLKEQNEKAQASLCTRYKGFNHFYHYAKAFLGIDLEPLSMLRTLDKKGNKVFISDHPNPLWIYPTYQKNILTRDIEDETPAQRKDSKEKTKNLKMKKSAKQIDDKKESDGFLSFLPASLLNIMEQVHLDRVQEETLDDNILNHAEDLDEITMGKKEANLASRIKMDLEIRPDMSQRYPVGEDYLLDEWDYQKNRYLIDYVSIKPQSATYLEPLEFPPHLKAIYRKVKSALGGMALEYITNKHLPYGDEINIDAWIEYSASPDKTESLQSFYMSKEQKVRDIATFILADVSLSTQSAISEEKMIIDVIKEGLMVFSEALDSLGDTFAIYSFSSLQNKKVYFTMIKNFKEPYSALIRGRIEGMKSCYYTRLGAALRASAEILIKQKNATKLLLLISDGKPHDEDRYDGRYGIEDSKKAIEEIRSRGMIPFCITVDVEAKSYMDYLFGKEGYVVVKDAQKLPNIISEIYMNLKV